MSKLFPSILITLDVLAAFTYAVQDGDWRHFILDFGGDSHRFRNILKGYLDEKQISKTFPRFGENHYEAFSSRADRNFRGNGCAQ